MAMSWISSREERVKIFIRARLRGLLRDAKAGLTISFEFGFDKFCGALEYSCCMGDISEETKKRVERLARTIKKKYFIK